MDLSALAKPHLKFRYAYARKGTNSADELNIYVSTDCGQTYTKRKAVKGTALRTASTDVPSGDYTPTTDGEWRETDVSLESFNQVGARLKFEWITYGGNNFYMDNINIYDAPTGVDENLTTSYGLNIFPNPTSNTATINYTLPSSSTVKVELFDLVGKKCADVFNGTAPGGIQEHQLNRDGLNSGVYFIKLTINNNSFTQKLVIQ